MLKEKRSIRTHLMFKPFRMLKIRTGKKWPVFQLLYESNMILKQKQDKHPK